MDTEDLKIIYQDDDIILADSGEETYLIKGGDSYRLSSHPYEPCLYIQSSDQSETAVHNSFTVDALLDAAQRNGTIRMITGNEYDIRGICRLMLKAVDISMDSVDIGYLEGQCFIDHMKERGAFSPETAVDLSEAGLKNPNMMRTFIHSKKVGKTDNGLFYVLPPKSHR